VPEPIRPTPAPEPERYTLAAFENDTRSLSPDDVEVIADLWRRAGSEHPSVEVLSQIGQRSRHQNYINQDDYRRIIEISQQMARGAISAGQFATWAEWRRPVIESNVGAAWIERVVAALRNEGNESEMVRSIAYQLLLRGTLSQTQMNVIQDRAREQASTPDTPVCPVHHVPMRQRAGQYGSFWGCPHYPTCRVTANNRGQFRNLPAGVAAPADRGLAEDRQREEADRAARATREAADRERSRRAAEDAIRASAGPSDSPFRTGQRPDGHPIPARSGTQDDAANPDYVKEFRRVLVATIMERASRPGVGQNGGSR
jgi:ssDNA-binding Zn-finger/Zn-ribbon topoisomerase 1